MQNTVVKHLITILLLLIYINRGFFVSSVEETYNPEGETNSVLELIVELVTGESNDIDEDGDQQSDCNHVQIIQHDFSQQFAQILELANLFSINKNNFRIPNKENLPSINFFDKIDKPPEMV
jgi:hypothetical protein